jgi:hypothetical protein
VVEYRVRQGSLLGPVLYLLHVSDLPLALEIRDSDGDSGYPDDTAVWVVAEDHDKAPLTFTVNVDGVEVKPVGTFDLLGVTLPPLTGKGVEIPCRPRSPTGATPPTWPTATAAWEWITDGKGSPLPPGCGKAEAARVNGRDPGYAGTGPVGREQRGKVRCGLQEGGPHHHSGPAGGGKVFVAEPAGGQGHGHVHVDGLPQQPRQQWVPETRWQGHV